MYQQSMFTAKIKNFQIFFFLFLQLKRNMYIAWVVFAMTRPGTVSPPLPNKMISSPLGRWYITGDMYVSLLFGITRYLSPTICPVRPDKTTSRPGALSCSCNGIMKGNSHLSRIMRKPTICICKNKDAGPLFCYMDSTITLLLKSEISSF